MWEAWVFDDAVPNTLRPGTCGEMRVLTSSESKENLLRLLSEYTTFYPEFIVVSPSGEVETFSVNWKW
jgi:hypothetical protein